MLPAIRRAHNARVVAIASREPERAQQAAATHDIPRAHPSYAALLQDSDVDAIYIPLPNSLHTEWTVAALAQGKHVLCEKPLALTTAEVDAIRRAASDKGLVVLEALMYRFHPQTARVQELIRSGALGEVQAITAAFTYHVPNPNDIRLKAALGGGVLYDVGTYCVSVARLVAQAEPDRVYGSARVGPASDVDEVFSGMLHFPQGIHAGLTCALHAPRDQWYRVTGSEGTLIVPIPFAPGLEDRELIVRRGWQRGKETEERITVPGADQYQLLVEHFADCILNGTPSALPLGETRANIAVVQALHESAQQNQPIHL